MEICPLFALCCCCTVCKHPDVMPCVLCVFRALGTTQCKANGTCVREWECSHCRQTTLKCLHSNLCTRHPRGVHTLAEATRFFSNPLFTQSAKGVTLGLRDAVQKWKQLLPRSVFKQQAEAAAERQWKRCPFSVSCHVSCALCGWGVAHKQKVFCTPPSSGLLFNLSPLPWSPTFIPVPRRKARWLPQTGCNALWSCWEKRIHRAGNR